MRYALVLIYAKKYIYHKEANTVKRTKQFLALLLSAILLCSFGVGVNAIAPEEEPEAQAAYAVPPEDLTEEEPEAQAVAAAPEDMTPEELEAYGRALLMQTMEDLRGDYTIGSIVHSGGRYAWLNSGGTYTLYLGNETLNVFPEQNAYYRFMSGLPYINIALAVMEMQRVKPKDITADTPINVTQYGANLCVTYDGIRYNYNEKGLLYSIADDKGQLRVQDYPFKEADLSLFDVSHMQKATIFQLSLWTIDWHKVWYDVLNIVLYPLTPFVYIFIRLVWLFQ